MIAKVFDAPLINPPSTQSSCLAAANEFVFRIASERTIMVRVKVWFIKVRHEGNNALSHQTSELLNGTLTPLAPSLL